MDCWNPIRIYNKGYANAMKQLNNVCKLRDNPNSYSFGSSNHRHIYDDSTLDKMYEHYKLLVELTPIYVYAPCRKCPPCLKKRSMEWSGRLIREVEHTWSNGGKVLFCTFTYNNKYIKSAPLKYKEQLAKFFDKLRSKYRRSIRHWCIPELGENTARFHIHALLFDVPDDFAPNGHYHRSKNGALMGSSSVLRKFWPYGLNDVGYLKEINGAVYLVNYLTKITDKSLQANNGIPFKGGIICSNKIGFLEYDEKELFDKARQGVPLTYNVANFDYQYPYTLQRKLLDPLKLRFVSFVGTLRRYALGGEYLFNKTYYNNYFDYRDAVTSAISITRYSQVLKPPTFYDNYDIQINNKFDYEDLI